MISQATTAYALGFALAIAASASRVPAQALPLSPIRESGQTVTPVFEGWYRNDDGTFSLSFGYFNRNSREVLDVPIGPHNFIAPGERNQGQPTHFAPRRHWGVFAVRVPADFGNRTVVWTLIVRGDTAAIPGHLRPGWEIDALRGEAGSGNTPPELWFAPNGPRGAGPGGVTTGPVRVQVGVPMAIDVWASDDGAARSSVAAGGRAGIPVTLAWFKHQGPGSVTFSPTSPPVDRATGRATTAVTFSAPGSYMIRVRANDASGVASAGHAQCCWSNGFVKVEVRGPDNGQRR